jgi:hypothetical protein
MNKYLTKTVPAVISVLYLCLPVSGTALGATGSGSDGGVKPVDSGSAGSGEAGQDNTGAAHEDILDRVFAPLDKAVDDVNRDLNKGEDKSATDAGE